jgi:hypothetical protein
MNDVRNIIRSKLNRMSTKEIKLLGTLCKVCWNNADSQIVNNGKLMVSACLGLDEASEAEWKSALAYIENQTR